MSALGELRKPLAAAAAGRAELHLLGHDGHLDDPGVCPAAWSAPMAEVSAHWPCGYEAFSMFAPTWMLPSAARSAAPTGKCE